MTAPHLSLPPLDDVQSAALVRVCRQYLSETRWVLGEGMETLHGRAAILEARAVCETVIGDAP